MLSKSIEFEQKAPIVPVCITPEEDLELESLPSLKTFLSKLTSALK